MPTNTAGTTTIICRAGIGKGRVVMTLIIAVHRVPMFILVVAAIRWKCSHRRLKIISSYYIPTIEATEDDDTDDCIM